MTADQDETFDLDTSTSRRVYSNRRTTRYIFGTAAAIFFALTVYGLAGIPRAVGGPTFPLSEHLFALVLVLFLSLFTASLAIFSAGRPATKLRLTGEALELDFPARSTPLRREWSDPRFALTVRDFRDHPTRATDVVQIERFGRAPFWLQSPSTPLTPAAFDGLLTEAQAKGLTVSRKRGGTFFALYPNTEITIRRVPGR